MPTVKKGPRMCLQVRHGQLPVEQLLSPLGERDASSAPAKNAANSC